MYCITEELAWAFLKESRYFVFSWNDHNWNHMHCILRLCLQNLQTHAMQKDIIFLINSENINN